jgi:hypothetical protein
MSRVKLLPSSPGRLWRVAAGIALAAVGVIGVGVVTAIGLASMVADTDARVFVPFMDEPLKC